MQITSGFLSDGVAAIFAWASEPGAANLVWFVATITLTALAGAAAVRIVAATRRRLAPVKVRKINDPRRGR